MRILLTADPEIPVPPIDYGGVQRLVASLIEEYRRLGHTVGLVAHSLSGVEVDNFFPFPGENSQVFKDSVQNSFCLYKSCKDFQPNILHSFSRLLYMLPLMRNPLPKIMTYGRSPGAKQVRYANTISDRSLGFTGCSQHIVTKGSVGGGVWKRVYNFVDLKKHTFREEYREDAPLVFLSRIEKIKGLHSAIDIAKASKSKLIIAGNRPELEDAKEYWKQEIEPYIDNEQIVYIGTVNDEERDRLLSKAKALIVPIEWEEPFGMVFTESLASGTPVISTARGAVPEIIVDGIHGFIISNVHDGIRAVSELHKIDRAECRKRVEELFTLEKVARQYLDFYQEMFQV